MSKKGIKFGAIALLSWVACGILPEAAIAASPATAAPRLLEYSDSAAVFLIEEQAVLVRLGERVPATGGTLRYLNSAGATIEYPSVAHSPGAMHRLQRGEVLPQRSGSDLPRSLEPDPALSAIQAPRAVTQARGRVRIPDPAP